MLKKITIILILIAGISFTAVNIFSRRAPQLLKNAIQKALNKDVLIRSIDYQFPASFELEGFEVLENAPFKGEPSFYVDRVRLDVSPFTLYREGLVLRRVQVENANIIVRKYKGKLTHTFTDAAHPGIMGAGAAGYSPVAVRPAPSPLEIAFIHLEDCNFQFIDYDVERSGYVVVLDQIDGKIKNIRLPFDGRATTYSAAGKLFQGRAEKPATFDLSGWTRFDRMDTDVSLSLESAHLPYFRPYYAQVTPALIQDGYLGTKASIRIQNNDLTADVDFEIVSLLFQDYEQGNSLFGLKAEEVLGFLKDQSSRLKFHIEVKWNLDDRKTRSKDVIRKSIERSLKRTVLGNMGDLIDRSLKQVLDADPKADETLEDKIEKLKQQFLKY